MIEFYSHPEAKLVEHLRGVGDDAKTYVKKLLIENKDYIAEIEYLIGIFHDFGKYTSYFQDYINEKEEIKKAKLKNKPETHHSFISAISAAWQVQKYVEVHSPQRKEYKYLPLIAYFVVLHHHGDLRCLHSDIPTAKDLYNPPNFYHANQNLRTTLKVTYEQVADLKEEERLESIKENYRKLKPVGDVYEFLNPWFEFLNSLSNLNQELRNDIRDNKIVDEEQIQLFLITLILYSALIDADKRNAGKVEVAERRDIPGNLVDRYREIVFDLNSQKYIHKIRNEIYAKVVGKVKAVPLKNHLFTLTAPTGSGKTLTAFSAALKLRERIRKEMGYTPRIIYSLPFISVIEQNYDEIRKILVLGSKYFEEISDFEKNEGVYLLKHHHLADLKYKRGDENRPLDEALLLTESWESEIIVTTFVQFLHTIIGFKNKFLKKYHNIAGSIILLDEVQNIPIEYWDIVEKTIRLLANYLGCYFILLTATKPLILREAESIELLEDKGDYFKRLDRIVIKPSIEERNIDDFIEWFEINYDSNKSHLIVVNTIKSSKEMYEKIRTCNFSNHLFYLSTSIIPKQREGRIKAIKDLLKCGDKLIVVSTQVIEAGVDLDFDEVIRDIGPIDSIIQVAGRCNREYNEKIRSAYVFCLDDYAYHVYGKIHPEVTKKMLANKEIKESDFHKVIDEYFNTVKPKINDDASKQIWEAMLGLKFCDDNKGVCEFQLIDEKGEYMDIFVEIDERAKNVWKKYCEKVSNEKDFKKRQLEYLSIRKDFRSYIISVRKDKDVSLPPEVCGFGYISNSQLNDYYSLETGFKTKAEAKIW